MNKILRLFGFLLLSLALLPKPSPAQSAKHTFALGEEAFLLDGKPIQLISGEMHYPRVPREAWRARMKMAKAMGLNTIGTYVFWNLHEPQPGRFDFTGNYDIAAFVRLAQEEGLWVVLRPSPYVCAEWEFGGYPYWLQQEKDLKVRSKDPKFLAAYRRYIQQVAKQLAPLQINHGGPVLMVQVENEYGFYSDDKEYMDLNRRLFIEAGFDGLLYTCDPAAKVARGHLPGLLPAVNGLDNPAAVKQLVRANHGGKGPFFIAEWYPAWFDWWGTPHHTVPAEKYAGRLDTVLAAGVSINMYMFHGGTTRGFFNGANYSDSVAYEPQISSYDYDAPLDEAGNATPKFRAFRAVIEKHLPAGTKLPPVPAAKPAITLPAVPLTQTASLFDLLPAPKVNARPLAFEDLNQAYGYVLYRTTVPGQTTSTLRIEGIRDYALVFVNGKRVGVLDRRLQQDSLRVVLPKGLVRLEILVENMGRINFGKYLLQNRKGITDRVVLGGKEVQNWQMFGLPFERADASLFKAAANAVPGGPVVKRGVFTLQAPGDTYLDMRTWGKGCVWVNGHSLGRYWSIGPQQTVYVPGEWLRKGENEIVVLELLKPEQRVLTSLPAPILSNLAAPALGKLD